MKRQSGFSQVSRTIKTIASFQCVFREISTIDSLTLEITFLHDEVGLTVNAFVYAITSTAIKLSNLIVACGGDWNYSY